MRVTPNQSQRRALALDPAAISGQESDSDSEAGQASGATPSAVAPAANTTETPANPFAHMGEDPDVSSHTEDE